MRAVTFQAPGEVLVADVPEPEAHAPEVSGGEVDSGLVVPPTDGLDAAPLPEVSAEADGTGPAAEPPVALKVDWSALDVAELEATAIETSTEPTLEFAPRSSLESARLEETSLEAERGEPASAPPEQDEAEAPATERDPNLADHSR